MARSHGLVVKGTTYIQKIVGLNLGAVYWMDVNDVIAITLSRK
jgi:hypothetical protein